MRPLSRIPSVKEKPVTLDRLLKAGISNTRDFLVTDVSVLMTATGLSLKQVQELVLDVSHKLCPPIVSAADIFEKQNRANDNNAFSNAFSGHDVLQRAQAINNNNRHNQATTELHDFWEELYLPFGWAALDTALGGGLPVGSLTEVCGPPCCGKTQLCLQMCAHTLLRAHAAAIGDEEDNMVVEHAAGSGSAHEPGTVLYIDLDLPRGSAKRLLDMLKFHAPTVCGSSRLVGSSAHLNATPVGDALTDDEANSLMGRVTVKSPKTMAELSAELADIQSTVIANKVKLLVIDNLSKVSAPQYLGGGDKEAVERYSLSLVAHLKGIAEECKCTVIIANELQNAADPAYLPTSHSPTNTGTNTGTSTSGLLERGIVLTNRPALGVAFHHCVCTRLLLCKLPSPPGAEADTSSAVVVEKSKSVGNSVIPFKISTGGLGGV